MPITVLYLNSCRRERLRDALAHTLLHLGPCRAAATVDALQKAYQSHNTTRTNYNFALHALQHVVGLEGLAAISLIKEAWNPNSLSPLNLPEPVADITHPSTNTTQ